MRLSGWVVSPGVVLSRCFVFELEVCLEVDPDAGRVDVAEPECKRRQRGPTAGKALDVFDVTFDGRLSTGRNRPTARYTVNLADLTVLAWPS
jgi:hypothetical protein